MHKLFEGARQNLGYVIKSVLLGIVFWLLEFAYQYFFFSEGLLESALIRSFALTGATLIGLALIIGPLAVVYPKLNFVPHRRTFGVIGFSFIILHVLSVTFFVFMGDILAPYSILDPFVNPLVWGFLAFVIFFLMWITSTDWAVETLSFKRWKNLHRLVYFAFIFAVIHFSLTNPPALETPPGYLLKLVTFLVIVLQLAGFAKRALKQKKAAPIIAGLIIILIGAVLFWLAFF